ncbi:trypsin beta-like [Euwallacea similis]|uniref:trypsin beta-like n=1 Tax=Euwallacea similis TaxID=1736056 RepID=UPI003450050B
MLRNRETLFLTFFIIYTKCAMAIIDGDLAEISDYPYAASIIADNLHMCGGSIIGAKHILTAASCVGAFKAANLIVRAGSSLYDEGGQLAKVESINLHPNFVEEYLLNNIAILVLSEALELGKNVTVIQWNTEDIPITGNGTIVGWGIVVKEENGWVKPYRPSVQLRVTHQPVVGAWTCENTFLKDWHEDTMFCAGLYRTENCVGDIGNPFVVNGIQVGIASEVLLICDEFPTAYINVKNYADFIITFLKS